MLAVTIGVTLGLR